MTKTIKILLFTPLPPPMHGSNYMAKLLSESALKKHFMFKTYNASYVTNINEIGAVSFNKIFRFIKNILYLFFISLTFNPNYVILIPAFNSYSFIRDFLIVYISRRLLNNKNILWIHSNNIRFIYERPGQLRKWMVKELFQCSVYVVPCAKELKNNMNYFCNSNNIKHIYNGINFDWVLQERITNIKLKIIYLSTMNKSKGWRILFESAKIICSYRNDVLFEFYGSESRSDSVKTINENFIGEKNIKYYGPVYGDKKFGILNTSDIFVFPPIEPEAFPLVILEAMACGLPVVTTDQGGITEAIIDGKGGFIVNKNDPKDLAEKLEILINDKELRLKMGEFNRQRYLENFTLEKFEENWIKFFNTIDK